MKFALIALCIILAGCDKIGHEPPPKESQEHFQLAIDGSGNAWVLDTRTGEAKRCWQGNPGIYPPTCYNATTKN